MAVEEIREYKFRYVPFDRGYPIKSCELTIVATSRKEAELVALNGWKFFDESCSCVVEEGMIGYRQVKEK